MNTHPLFQLIEKYLSGEITPEETAALRQLLTDPEQAAALDSIMDRQLANSTVTADDFPEVVDRIKKSVIRQLPVTRHILIRRLAIAAAILLLCASAAFLWFSNRSSQSIAKETPVSLPTDLPPGKNGAILTLADGKKVVLDSLGNGVIATQNGSKVLLNNGHLAYTAEGDKIATAAVAYNTMTTPKGRQFQLVLPDGTKIWLNAASSLRYPTRFTGAERKVEITGEAYFEVAQNAKMPFIVQIGGKTEIQVLGTHFNINAYDDEATANTTLLEGSVRVVHDNEKAILRPGQQAQVTAQSVSAVRDRSGEERINILNNVNVDKVVAWKNCVFDFQDASLEEVMRQLERWYDIEVVYEKNIPKLEFIGKMGRDLTLSNVLRGLELSKVHFRMEGERRLVILP